MQVSKDPEFYADFRNFKEKCIAKNDNPKKLFQNKKSNSLNRFLGYTFFW
jgi:hypothetical protein